MFTQSGQMLLSFVFFLAILVPSGNLLAKRGGPLPNFPPYPTTNESPIGSANLQPVTPQIDSLGNRINRDHLNRLEFAK